MKPLLAALLLVSSGAIAQPIITGATNNPVAGDKFLFHLCDTAGITPGASGAAVTWDFSSAHNTTNATISFVSCAPTPYCDSFAGANLATDMLGGDYGYIKTSAAGLDNLGEMGAGGHLRYSKPYRTIAYPLAYNTLTVDTAVWTTGDSPLDTMAYRHFTLVDSNFCDGYGTVILPTGTVNNVLRVRVISTVTDSTWHAPSAGLWEKEEYIYYYALGFRYPLVELIYIIEPAPFRLNQVWYATQAASSVQQQNTHPAASVYPNPAGDVTHIRFSTTNAGHTSVVLTSVTGNVVYTVPSQTIIDGDNEIAVPVASMPSGLYLCKVQSPESTAVCKVVVAR